MEGEPPRKVGEDEIALVAGDSDYVPAIEKLKKRGIPVHVVFWGHAAREVRESATKFINHPLAVKRSEP